MVPYENCKIIGPYLRKDGRSHVCIKIKEKWKTVSYPKYLLELHIGRYLIGDETVDHKNEIISDNRLENLQILPSKENIKKSAKPIKWLYFCCPVCKVFSKKRLSKVRHNRKQGKIGPFCSKKCAGIGSSQK